MPLSERTVTQTIDAMVATGMRDAGYRYVNLDAGWAAPTRDGDGDLRAEPDRFPGGIARIADYAHHHGMYLGLYASPFDEICGQDPRVASAGHERQDARLFAEWGVDYLKYDWCRTAADHDDQVERFTTMRDALRHSGRRIIFSINPNSSGDPTAGSRYDWSAIADLTRNTVDLVPAWGDSALPGVGVFGIAQQFAAAGDVKTRSRPGYWPDPDMLVIGIPWATFTAGHPTLRLGAPRPDLTEAEQRANLSLWAMLAAPLLAGNDPRSMSQATQSMLTNREVIAVDQDPDAIQGHFLPGDAPVVIKPLADGSVAVALINDGLGDGRPIPMATDAAAVGLPAAPCYTVRDLWAHTSHPTPGPIRADAVPPHGVALLRVSPGECSR